MTTTISAVPPRVNLDVYQGDDCAFTVTVTGLSLVGAAAAAQIRHHPGAPSVLAEFTATVDDTAGTISLLLPAADTALLPAETAAWDLQVTAAGHIRTLLAGAVKIAAQVTV